MSAFCMWMRPDVLKASCRNCHSLSRISKSGKIQNGGVLAIAVFGIATSKMGHIQAFPIHFTFTLRGGKMYFDQLTGCDFLEKGSREDARAIKAAKNHLSMKKLSYNLAPTTAHSSAVCVHPLPPSTVKCHPPTT